MADGPTLIPLDNVDPALVEALLDRAFEPERHTRTAYKVREGTDWLPGLSFAAIDNEEHLVGTIQCWPVALTDPSGRRHPLIMVGPVAVEPEAQGQGYGQALMTAALAALSPQAPLPQVMRSITAGSGALPMPIPAAGTCLARLSGIACSPAATIRPSSPPRACWGLGAAKLIWHRSLDALRTPA